MGNVWLLDLPRVLAADPQLRVSYWPGWELRSRISGGFTEVRGIGIHHTASPIGTTTEQACQRLWNIAPLRPVSSIYLARDGEVVVGAAGAANTMGRGGPLAVSKGVVPQDQGNATMIAIEAGNNGVGEPWATVMVDAYLRLCRALVNGYGLETRDIFTHNGYCQPSTPGRKIDPRGPTPGYPMLGGDSLKIWDQVAFRQLVTELPTEDEMQTALAAIYQPTAAVTDFGADPVWFVLLPNGHVRPAAGSDSAYIAKFGLPMFLIEANSHYQTLLDDSNQQH